MALGQTLKEARERKGLTTQQVAESTRMLVQIVEDLERENFRRIAAPLYGRGFIKLFAECVGVDHEPLVAEFMDIYTGNRPPQVARREVPTVPKTTRDDKPAVALQADPPLCDAPAALPATPPTNAHQQIVPLDEPPTPADHDLFSVATAKPPVVVSPVGSRSLTSPQVKEKIPAREPEKAKGETTPVTQSPRATKNEKHPEHPKPTTPRPSSAMWQKSRDVGQAVVKRWQMMTTTSLNWLTFRRLIWFTGIVGCLFIAILGIRYLKIVAKRSAERSKPVISQQVLPPPTPYVQ